jgi:peptide/nickel transport system substrate-binding protein
VNPRSDRAEDSAFETRVSRRELLRTGAAGAGLMAAAPLIAACGSSSSSSSTAAKAKRGGNLRVAMIGGTPDDTLEADAAYNFPEVMRNFALYNGLVALDASGHTVSNDLAEEITPSKDALTWTIRLRPDVTFHNGKTLSAHDVVFTLQRIANPKNLLSGASALAPVDLNNVQILDPRTLKLHMKTPYATFIEQISANYYFGIVPVGYNPKKPIGTGPFKYQSFTPGQQSVFARNANYYKNGLPYLDQLTIIDSFSDPTTAMNALSSGSVDVFENAPPALAAQAQGNPALRPLISNPGLWVPFTMRADVAPFKDVRVRQAFRLIVNRPQMLASSVSGLGVVASDVYGLYDSCFDSGLKREQDIAQAKSLLKAAGQSNLQVELVSAPIAAGATESAQIFAQQAKAAGVTVNLRQIGSTAFFANYLKWPFAQDFIAYSPFMSLAAQTSIPNAPFNETHFDNPKFNSLYNEANKIGDQSSRCGVIDEMQRILFDEGAYIIPSFNKTLDIMSTKVNGFQQGAGTGIPLGNGDWEHAWID